MLFPDTISDLVWGTKGYKGLLAIQSEFNVDVYYKENIRSDEDILKAIDDLHKKESIFYTGTEMNTRKSSI